MLENGFFICKFDLEEDLQRIQEGFWTIKGHLMILRRWSPEVTFEIDSLKTIPLWITLHGVPLHLWTRKFFSRLCSIIGTPLHLDKLTTSRQQLQFARACVLVSAESELPDKIFFKDFQGRERKIHVSYPWKLSSCCVCKSFGHLNGYYISGHEAPKKNFLQQEKFIAKKPLLSTLSSPSRRSGNLLSIGNNSIHTSNKFNSLVSLPEQIEDQLPVQNGTSQALLDVGN